MKTNNHGLYSLVGIGLLFVVNLFLMFFLSPNTEGNMPSWVIAIVIGTLDIIALTMLLKKELKNNMNTAVIIIIFMVVNLVMIAFSISDIAGTKNYTLSTITFVAVPLGSLVTIGYSSNLNNK